MTTTTYACTYPGCTARTVYSDGLCRIHRRSQVSPNKINVSTINDALGRPAISGRAQSVMSVGRRMTDERPIVVVDQKNHAIAISKFIRKGDKDMEKIKAMAEGQGGRLLEDGDHYAIAFPDSVASPRQAQVLADNRYASYTFGSVAGGNANMVEQYDDPGEAIIQLNIPARHHKGIKMVYMNAAGVEKIRLHAGNYSMVGRIERDSDLSQDDKGRVYQGYHLASESLFNGNESLDPSQMDENFRGIVNDVCTVRSVLNRYEFKVEGHDDSAAFFVPAGWMDNDI